MTIVTTGESSGLPGLPDTATPVDVHDGDTTSDNEDVVRLGDGHLSGVESLCVGESQ